MGPELMRWLEMSERLSPSDRRAALSVIADRMELVLVPRGQYERLAEAEEDLADRAACDAFEARLAAGAEELLPAAMVDRLIAGEHPVRVWREHRGMTEAALAEKAGLAASHLSQIERGAEPGSVSAMKALAAALDVAVDDLV